MRIKKKSLEFFFLVCKKKSFFRNVVFVLFPLEYLHLVEDYSVYFLHRVSFLDTIFERKPRVYMDNVLPNVWIHLLYNLSSYKKYHL